jgi:mevalonate kinase
MGVTASAAAKIILFGEHFVVYGEPAIVIAIDKRAYATVDQSDDKCLHVRSANLNLKGYFKDGVFKVEQGDIREAKLKFEPVRVAVERVLAAYKEQIGLDVEINSTVPVGAGLGSSAAVVAAVTEAAGALLNVKMTKEDVFRVALEAERVVHGTASVVDPAIATFGGTLLFQTDTGFKPLEVKTEVPLVIGNTGVERSTKVQVDKVRAIAKNYPQIMELMKKTAREIVLRAMDAFKHNDLKALGDLMNVNHALLYGIGVSDESLEWLINAAKKAGAYGAKLTGAGGGGCMIALANEGKLQDVLDAIMRAGGKTFHGKED